jgi:hypothetical protein
VTPGGGVTTSGSGTFSTSITVPAVADGIYGVTAVDSNGNWATASLTVSATIPEVLPLAGMIILSSVAVLVGSRYFGRKSQVEN